MHRRFAYLPVSVLLIVAFLVLGSGAQAERAGVPPTQDGVVVSKAVSPAEQEAALAFWTRDAIAKAQPMEMPSQLGPAEVDKGASVETGAMGAPGMTPSGLAAPDADKVAQAAFSLDWAALKESVDNSAAAVMEGLGPEGTSQTHTSYTVNKLAAVQRVYPHNWVGRLSFRTPGGTSYCSGTSISGNVMLTAAHCVYDTTNNRFYSNWVFTPAYRNGNAPYGSFAATTCWVLTSWVNLSGGYSINNWARHDVAVCRMGNNGAGQTLNNAVGWMGREWNASYVKHFHNLGYPFKNYNDVYMTDAGLYLRTCVAESFQQTTETRGMGCYYGGGISGGPWMTNYALNVVSGRASGVNSGLYVGTQNIYAGRFNSNNIVPLCNAAGC